MMKNDKNTKRVTRWKKKNEGERESVCECDLNGVNSFEACRDSSKPVFNKKFVSCRCKNLIFVFTLPNLGFVSLFLSHDRRNIFKISKIFPRSDKKVFMKVLY